MSISKWPQRAALFAACLGATAAAGTASAGATTVPAENIYGMGSSLQAIAQNDGVSPAGPGCSATGWQGWIDVWGCNATLYQTTLTNHVTADYTTESSGVGLAEFGNAGSASCVSTTGVLSPACDPTANAQGELDSFIGTDDPPNSTQLTNAQTASGGPQEITIPVTEAPVAMILSLPTDITLRSTTEVKLPSQAVADAWSGTVPVSSKCTAIDPSDPGNTWCDLLVEAGLSPTTGAAGTTTFHDGSDDGGPIILQARSKGSGTTYSFRGYLYELDKYGQTSSYPYSLVTDGPTDWPVTTTQTGNTSGGALVADTTATPGSFGYANLADAALASPAYTKLPVTTTTGGSHQILYALVQNNTADGSAAFYALPSASAGTTNLYTGANIGINVSTCAAPSTTLKVGCWLVPSTATGPWSSTSESTPGTIPSDADVRDHGKSGTGTLSGAYPIVATTYDVAWTDYDTANLNSMYTDTTCPPTTNCAADAGNATKSFLTFVTGTGQSKLTAGKVYYGSLPSAIKSKATTFVKSITP